jgi:hypothetical protein
MSTQPVENLELRAIEQRNHLHETTAELKRKIEATREKFDPSRNVRQHFLGVAVAAAAIGLISGYGLGGALTRR